MSQATLESATLDQTNPLEADTLAVGSEAAAASGMGAATEELLNKMDGTEVDRLLAETEAERAVADAKLETESAPIAAATETVAQTDAALASEMDDLLTGMEEPGGAPASKVEPPASKVEPSIVETQVASAVETSAETVPAAKQEETAQAAVAAPAAAVVDPAASAAAEEARLKVLAAELEVDKPAATAPPIAAPAPAVVAAPVAHKAAVEKAAQRSNSFLVRILMLINAPIAGLSNSFRSAFGAVAVVNVLVATALIVYAILTHKGH